MQVYLDLLKHILTHGNEKPDRTGTGTRAVFGYQMRFDLSQGFPLITTKKMHFKSIVYELLWFLRGDTNVGWLQEHGVSIWNEWADENGDLGPIYGKQWRDCAGHDQIRAVIDTLRKDPNSRRMVVSAWNVAELSRMALFPCHALFQFFVVNGKLSCQLYQRSADVFLGVPFNIASYALLTMMIAQQTELIPGEFIWTGGDVHLYNNHVDQAQTQLTRAPYPLPTISIEKATDIDTYQFSDFKLDNYQSHATIQAPIAV